MKNQRIIPARVGDFINWGAGRFEAAGLCFGHGTDNAWDEALSLVLFVLNLPWDSDVSVLQRSLSTDEQSRITSLFDRRINERIPAAYLIGEAWFAELSFAVDQRVLVPRSPIAELIESGFSPWLKTSPATVLDLCSGSGCIGIACAHYFPEAHVVLSDISVDALDVAEKNIQRYQLSERVITAESDLFAGLCGQRFDLIVANPPYVDAEDLADMPSEFLHEPAIGLASGIDGLDFTRRLINEALDYLTEEGSLIVEVGNSWLALEDAFPTISFLWIDFERGGHGVFLLTAQQLRAYRLSLDID